MAAKKSQKKNSKGAMNKVTNCLQAPLKILSKALDFYVRSITSCSGRARYGPSALQLQGLPKSLSSGSTKSTILYTDEDFRELIRAASTRSLRDNNKFKLDLPDYYHTNGKIARSFTSGFGRIDEDKPCEFGQEVRVDVNISVIYPRSQSHAVPRGGLMIS